MIVIISPEARVANETLYVNSFFENGLDVFHVRKYEFSDNEMQNYLNGIDKKFRSRIVLHSHFHLAKELDVNRLHFREYDRLKKSYVNYEGHQLSTSVHSIEDFNKLDELWRYAFLSPVFPSISKAGYGEHYTVLIELKRKNNRNVKLIALGGIQAENCKHVMDNAADGIALLGSIWQSQDPLNTFLSCRKIVR